MSKKTTVKPIELAYGAAGQISTFGTKLMGILKGLAIGQDEPDETTIDAEFFDAPFDIIYEGKPVTFTFELANYELSELPPLFGGTYDSQTGMYEGAANAFTSNHAWKLRFQRGFDSLMLYNGLTVGTLKKDADSSLNYSVKITATTFIDENDVAHMYAIKESA